MKRTLFIMVQVILSLLLMCSTEQDIAGSKGGSETTNGISANIHHDDGTPAVGVAVRLRRSDFVSSIPTHPKPSLQGIDTLTDIKGNFGISNIEPGTYSIEVFDISKEQGAILFTVTVGANDTINLGNNSLHPFATINGIVDTTDFSEQLLYAQVRGLEHLVPIEKSGLFVLNNLPTGNLDIRIIDSKDVSNSREILNIKVLPNDTARVLISGKSTFSRFVYLNTTATGAAITSNLFHFPLLVRLDSSTFDFAQAKAAGDDIRFEKADGNSLPYEIEQWNPVAKHVSVWVKIDTVFGNSKDQFIVLKWGDPSASYKNSSTSVFDTANGFAGVWHLNENPAAGSNAIKDRTSNGYNGTANGSMTSKNVVDGMIGSALMYDGNDDYVSAGKLNLTGNYSLSCWINASDLSSARRFIWKEYSYTLWYDAIGQGIRVEHFTDSLVWRGIYQDGASLWPLNLGVWYYLTSTYDGDRMRLYVNGELIDSTKTLVVNPRESQQQLSLGGRSGEFVKGVMDEIRLENSARSADWIRLNYKNQKQDNTVISLKK